MARFRPFCFRVPFGGQSYPKNLQNGSFLESLRVILAMFSDSFFRMHFCFQTFVSNRRLWAENAPKMPRWAPYWWPKCLPKTLLKFRTVDPREPLGGLSRAINMRFRLWMAFGLLFWSLLASFWPHLGSILARLGLSLAHLGLNLAPLTLPVAASRDLEARKAPKSTSVQNRTNSVEE